MKEKIFFIINSLEMGGAEKNISFLASSLAKNHDVVIASLGPGLFFPLPENVKHVVVSHAENPFLKLLLLPIILLKLRRLIRKEKPSCVVSSLELSNFLNILINKDRANICMETSLDFFSENTFKNKMYRHYIQKLYPRAGRIFVNCQENLIDMSDKLSIPVSKFALKYNPIDYKATSKLKSEELDESMKHLLHGKQVFVTVSRLIKTRNVDVMIRSFVALNADKKKILVVIGQGPELGHLQELVADQEWDDHVVFVGQSTNVYKYMAVAHYFIYASSVESSTNVLIESMACKLPIISTDFRVGAREIIDPSLKLSHKIIYPYYGPNGVLIRLDSYQSDLAKVFTHISAVHQKQKGMERFFIEHITKEFLKNKINL